MRYPVISEEYWWKFEVNFHAKAGGILNSFYLISSNRNFHMSMRPQIPSHIFLVVKMKMNLWEELLESVSFEG